MYRTIFVAAVFGLTYSTQSLAEDDCATNIESSEKLEAAIEVHNNSELQEKLAEVKALCQAGKNEEANKLLTQIREHALMRETMESHDEH